MRFTLQGYAKNANLDTSDTVKINECVAGSYDPLIELIQDIIKNPAWILLLVTPLVDTVPTLYVMATVLILSSTDGVKV